MTINQLLQKLEPTSPILQANFGIERESLRVDRQGKLAHTPHPSCLGARSFHPYIQTDFCEFQMELITPVAKSTTEARRFLGAITDVAGRSISKDELLWPLSMPPRIKAQEIQVAQLENEFERYYRNYLAEKYGTKLQAISGIHSSLANTDTLKGVEVEVTEFQIGDSLVKEGAINFLSTETNS